MNVTIDDLVDIGNTQQDDALAAVQQNGITFKARERPNPPRQKNITSQAQLEQLFGVNIEIPDGESWLISVDESFTLTKPIKLGLGSSLRIVGTVANVNITYSGPDLEGMFQNTNPANLIDSFDMRLIGVISDTNANNLFDLRGTSFFFINTAQITDFADIGTVEMPLIEIQSLGMISNSNGFKIINPTALSIRVVVVNQSAFSTQLTAFSFIQANPTLVILDDIRGLGFSVDDSLIFFDPNAPTGAAFVTTNATKDAGSLFQPGADIAATANAASSPISGGTQFNITGHNLTQNQIVVLKGFTGFPAYNGTFKVLSTNGANSVDIDVPFVGVDATGDMSAKSLDSKDPLVSAFNNPGEPDSMSHAEARSNGTLVVTGAQNTRVPVEDITPVSGDWIQDLSTERFTVDPITGIATYNGTEDKTLLIQYQLTAMPNSGGAQVLNFDISINLVQQIKSLITINTATTDIGQYIGGLFVLSPGDTVQLFRDNTTNATDTDVSVATMLITAS
jgi:hypothetical protein